MSNTLPKEKQTAYQRWEMASFGDDRPRAGAQMAGHVGGDQSASQRQQARKDGYAAGLAEGRQTGLQEGRARAAEETARLNRIANSFQQEITRANELIAQDMLDVSLDLAKAMMKTALKIKPELIIPVVSEAIHYLPSLQLPASLFLHPEDMKAVKQFMGDELTKTGWRVLEDPQMQRGGCRVETASNQIDATPATRWQRIVAALDKNNDWLDT